MSELNHSRFMSSGGTSNLTFAPDVARGCKCQIRSTGSRQLLKRAGRRPPDAAVQSLSGLVTTLAAERNRRTASPVGGRVARGLGMGHCPGGQNAQDPDGLFAI